MAFDITTARPVSGGGFDIKTARPVKQQIPQRPFPAQAAAGVMAIPRPPVFPSELTQKTALGIASPLLSDAGSFLERKAGQVKSAAFSTPFGKTGIGRFAIEEAPFSPQELALSMGTELMMPFAGAGLKKAASTIAPIFKTSERAERIMASALKLNPSDRARIAKPNIAGTSPEKWLLERQIKGSPEEIVDKLESISSASKKAVDTALSKSQSRHRFPQARQALTELEDLFRGVPGNEETLAKVVALKKKFGKEVLVEGSRGHSLSELNEVKRLIDRHIDIFKTTGDVKAGAKAEGLKNIRQNIQKFIETQGDVEGIANIKGLNKETQVAREIGDAISKKELAKMGNNIINLTDFIVASGLGAGTGVFLGAKEGVGAGLVSAGALVAKKVAENPSFKIKIAMSLQRLSPNELKVLQSGIKTETGKEIYKKVVNMALRQGVIQAGAKKASPMTPFSEE